MHCARWDDILGIGPYRGADARSPESATPAASSKWNRATSGVSSVTSMTTSANRFAGATGAAQRKHDPGMSGDLGSISMRSCSRLRSAPVDDATRANGPGDLPRCNRHRCERGDRQRAPPAPLPRPDSRSASWCREGCTSRIRGCCAPCNDSSIFRCLRVGAKWEQSLFDLRVPTIRRWV
jgi:hypothetical protein